MAYPEFYQVARAPSPLLKYLGILLLSLFWLGGCQQDLKHESLPAPVFTPETLEKMRQTRVTNMAAILEQKHLGNNSTEFLTRNPYKPVTPLSDVECQASSNCQYAKERALLGESIFPARPVVYQWWKTRPIDAASAEVCGLRFEDENKTAYQLKTFSNLAALQKAPGFRLTHFQACGTCSTLQDLAVYGELDLTRMAKTCSKRLSLDDKKTCMRKIGFTEACAETWAYNGQHTGQRCALTCVKEYGLFAILSGTEDKQNTNKQGVLNACLQCDELLSGPGFQYGAGRIRRNSGIISEIERPDNQVYKVDHDYFD